MHPVKPMSRRLLLRQAAGMLGSVVLLPIALYAPCSRAGSANRAVLHYQDNPRDGKMCSTCTAFTPEPATEPATGSCKVLGEAVSAHGWCLAYSER